MTREIFFGTSIAGFNFPLKTTVLSWSQSIFFFLLSPSFYNSIMRSIANSMLLVAVLIVYVHRKSSNKRLRGVYLILRVQEGGQISTLVSESLLRIIFVLVSLSLL